MHSKLVKLRKQARNRASQAVAHFFIASTPLNSESELELKRFVAGEARSSLHGLTFQFRSQFKCFYLLTFACALSFCSHKLTVRQSKVEDSIFFSTSAASVNISVASIFHR